MLIYNFPGAFVEGRAMELGIIDIEADVEFVLFHRRLCFHGFKWCHPLLRYASMMIVLDTREAGRLYLLYSTHCMGGDGT